ncbi:MAG: hypothetical protein RJA09_524, partial [Pseudomonadota bacterium]
MYTKNKFHANKRLPSRAMSVAAPALGATVALIDERYLSWLTGQHTTREAAVQWPALVPVLGSVLRQQGGGVLLRACVYSERAPGALVDDVLVRHVAPHAVDGGWGLVRAMGLELVQLAQRGACQQVWLACDDERLTPYIDEAQWAGLKVVMLVDEPTLDTQRLRTDDPSWARLLAQADRRVALPEAAWAALGTPGYQWSNPEAGGAEVGEEAQGFVADQPPEGPPSDDWRQQVLAVIQGWWAEETPHAKEDLYDEMLGIQGVPPETDRH